jgi:chemotaxis protein methyltransferase CheR
MRPEEHTRALGGALSAFGLDLTRYTVAHALGFIERFPDPEAWTTEAARASLISTFAIGETTFMRHPEHFAAVRAILPELCKERALSPVRVWSAGCASGEEAYSLAATLASAGAACEVIGWDVNPEAIARARMGEYRPWSLRGVEVQATEGWLAPAPSGVRVEGWLRDRISFEVGNLHRDDFPGQLDLIFCRNVLLYFRREAAARVLVRMAESLRPGGALFLGHYDPPPPPEADLEPQTLDGTLFYRKRRGERRIVVPAEPVVLALPQQTYPALARVLPPRRGRTTQAGHGEAPMQQVRLLVNQQRTGEALSMLAEMSAGRPLLPELHILTALAAEDSGDVRRMLDAARRACFLLPDQPGPNYFLSVAFVRNGELRRAAVHRRIAAAALRSADRHDRVVEYSEGLTVGQLRRLLGAVAR